MAKRLHEVEERFLATIKKYNLIEKNDKIVVAVSGGPDSITLLDLLYKYKEKYNLELYVCHINHKIRKEADDDANYVKDIASKMNLQYFEKEAKIEKLALERKKGTEEIGREVRYAFFDEVQKKTGANKIAIAHNMNDNAETVILNLIRGTGLGGLEGILAKRDDKYIRPLIEVERKYIEDYCEINKLNPRIDSTNSQNIYKRNVVRNEILKELKTINPNIVETISRTSDLIKANNEFLQEHIDEAYKRLVRVASDKEKNEIIKLYNAKATAKDVINIYQEDNKIDVLKISIKLYNSEYDIIKQSLIFEISNKYLNTQKDIEKKVVDNVIEIANNNIGKKMLKINSNISTIVYNNSLYFLIKD